MTQKALFISLLLLKKLDAFKNYADLAELDFSIALNFGFEFSKCFV